MKLRHRVPAALATAALAMGGAVLLAEPAAATPKAYWGQACPSGDTDVIAGGTLVKKWNLRQAISTNQCQYLERTCNVGYMQACWGDKYVIFYKQWRS